jgi:UDP-glucose 4-epimerase
MKILVTGAAGFIGSSLVDRLLAEGHSVVGIDNFSTGRREFLAEALENPNFKLFERDLFELSSFEGAMTPEISQVYHLAANADVKDGLLHPRKDLEQNTIVTWNVLESMRKHGVKKIGFSSTGSVYGEAAVIPTPEACPFPIQTSLYGASKLAGEALISAYAEGYGMKATIYRFVSILGERYTHGHVFDFLKALQKDPSQLRVLGNGKQRKSYLYIQDCIDAILLTSRKETARPVEVYNLGTDEYVDVDASIEVICKELGVSPKKNYTGGERGWVGDNPFIFLDCAKLREAGWKPKQTIRDSVRLTIKYLLANPWVFKS